MAMFVKDVMSSPVVSIDQDKRVKDAGLLMKKTRRGSLLVLSKGKPVGIVTEADLVRRVLATGVDPIKAKVKQVMSRPIVTVKSGDELLGAVRVMKRINAHRLPVMDEAGKLVGLLSLSDVAKTSPEMADLLEYKEKMREEEPILKSETTAGICDSCENYSERLRHIEDQWLCEDCVGDVEEE